MIKVNKGNVEVVGTESTVFAELATLLNALMKTNPGGTLASIAVGLNYSEEENSSDED